MLQQNEPEDFVIATGASTTVREFARLAFLEVGVEIKFKGAGKEEVGVIALVSNKSANLKTGQEVIRVDPNYLRPSEVDRLQGDASKAQMKLGWEPKVTLKELVREMVLADQNSAMRHS
jgi:GDPmannose 4,6-dehydratase